MALAPIVRGLLPKPKTHPITGKTTYRDARGKFTSKANYERLARRGPGTGRWGRTPLNTQQAEQLMRRIMNNATPPAGRTWVALAERYSDRFSDYLGELEQALR